MKREEGHRDAGRARREDLERPCDIRPARRRSQSIKHSTEEKQKKSWREIIRTTIQIIVFGPLFLIMAVLVVAFVGAFLYLAVTDNMQEFMAAVGGTILGMMVHYFGWIVAIMLCGLFALWLLADGDAKNK